MYSRTPCIPSPSWSAASGCEVWLKLENAQPVGSFKIRGISVLASRAAERGARRLVSSSGGNAGLAAAHAGRLLGLAVTVVVPETTPERMRRLIEIEGARVLVRGSVWDEAHAHALELAAAGDAAYVPPFDHPDLWRGHASLVRELADDLGAQPAWVVVSVGGGGLLAGVLEGLDDLGWDDTRVLAVETRGADAMARSLEAGEVVTLDAITSVARSLGARKVSPTIFERARARGVVSQVVSDAEATAACVRFADDHRALVEPACGAALAAALRWTHAAPEGPVVVVVCGGANVTMADLDSWRRS